MRSPIAWVLVLVVGSALFVEANGTPATVMLPEDEIPIMSSSFEIDGKPARPRLFQSPEQIRMYLETLGKYYNSQNRNRFGKRSGNGPRHVLQYKDPFDSKTSPDYDLRIPMSI